MVGSQSFVGQNSILPQQNLTHIHGAPVRTDDLQTRYIPDMQKNHSDLPFENKVKVIEDDHYVNLGTPSLIKDFNFWESYFN